VARRQTEDRAPSVHCHLIRRPVARAAPCLERHETAGRLTTTGLGVAARNQEPGGPLPVVWYCTYRAAAPKYIRPHALNVVSGIRVHPSWQGLALRALALRVLYRTYSTRDRRFAAQCCGTRAAVGRAAAAAAIAEVTQIGLCLAAPVSRPGAHAGTTPNTGRRPSDWLRCRCFWLFGDGFSGVSCG